MHDVRGIDSTGSSPCDVSEHQVVNVEQTKSARRYEKTRTHLENACHSRLEGIPSGSASISLPAIVNQAWQAGSPYLQQADSAVWIPA